MKENVINQEQKDDLNRLTKNLMMKMSKDDIYHVAEVHALEPNDEMSKEELVEKINEVLVQEFEHDCQYLLPDEIFYMMDLFLQFEKKNPTKINSLLQLILNKYEYEKDEEDGDYLIQMGYFQTQRINDHQTWLLPYPSIMISFVSNLMPLLKKSFENQKMLDYAIGLTNIYGWYPYAQYVHIWNLYNENKITEDFADILLEKMDMKSALFWLEDETVINIDIPVEEYGFLAGKRKTLPWYTPSEEMIENNKYSHVDENSEAYKALKAFFTKNRGTIKTNREIELIIFQLLLEIKFDSIPSTAFDILEEHNYVFKDDETGTKFLKMYLDLSNNARKWVLKGFTPFEVNAFF
ncbi:MAG: hypothetical protein ACOC34_05725 [Thermotogota bacterium]